MLGIRHFAIDEEVVGEEIESALRGDGRIENADGAGGGVAGVDENLAADVLLLAIHGFEGLASHHDFAANFERRRQLGFFEGGGIDAQRNRANRFHVGRDVFSGGAVAAGDAANEKAIFILEGNAEAIELVLGDVFDFLAADSLADAAIELAESVVGKSVVETEHGPRVADGLETFAGRAADADAG